MYVCMHLCTCVCMYVCMYACINVCIVCMHLCTYVRMYACMHVCMYACINVCIVCMYSQYFALFNSICFFHIHVLVQGALVMAPVMAHELPPTYFAPHGVYLPPYALYPSAHTHTQTHTHTHTPSVPNGQWSHA